MDWSSGQLPEPSPPKRLTSSGRVESGKDRCLLIRPIRMWKLSVSLFQNKSPFLAVQMYLQRYWVFKCFHTERMISTIYNSFCVDRRSKSTEKATLEEIKYVWRRPEGKPEVTARESHYWSGMTNLESPATETLQFPEQQLNSKQGSGECRSSKQTTTNWNILLHAHTRNNELSWVKCDVTLNAHVD